MNAKEIELMGAIIALKMILKRKRFCTQLFLMEILLNYNCANKLFLYRTTSFDFKLI